MILTDDMVQEAIDKGEIKLEPFEKKQIKAATYDMRVGGQAVTTSSQELRNLEEKGFVIFEPGDFGFVITMEKISISPQYAARFGLRASFARKGLTATVGPQIDPGFRGRLIIGLSNLTPNPITISHGDDLISVEFHQLPKPVAHPYHGKYQDVMALRPEDIALVTEKKGMLLSEMQATLSSLSLNVGTLTRDLRRFENVIFIAIGLLGLFIAIVAIID